jgi:hypothetical protein
MLTFENINNPNPIHTVYYKSYQIILENGQYKIPQLPLFPFSNLNQAKKEIDKVTKDLDGNLQNLKELINKKAPK